MTQSQIDRAVARAMDADIQDVRDLGFSLLDPAVEFFDPDCDCQPAQVLDWDGPAGNTAVRPFHEVAA